jgi:peptidoglycan hydrolase CwlO-like protein
MGSIGVVSGKIIIMPKINNLTSKMFLCAIVLCFALGALFKPFPVVSQGCSSTDYDCQIRELQQEYDARKDAHEKNKSELESFKKQIASIQKKLADLDKKLKDTEKEIKAREFELAEQEELMAARLREMYKRNREFNFLTFLLSSKSVSDFSQDLGLRRMAAKQDWQIITLTSERILNLKKDKDTLKKNQASLSSLKSQVDKQAAFLADEIEKMEGFFADIKAKQEAILAKKAGSFITSVGDVELADDYNASIKGFRESAPAGSFAVFSFGGYTHRKGMSQYGARGRAENGQDYKQILKAYYGKEPVNKDTSGNILVNGSPMDFEGRYLLGIAEMPSSWNINALKAQAVAARTYAYRYKTQGKSICTTQACQVFNSSKANNPPSAWKQAVEETRGQVLEDVVTYYSSTVGGYMPSTGWDTTDGSGGGDFISKAWESKGGSPWLYKAWYREGYSSSGATCGKGNPWLTGTELADIVNAALVLKNKNDERISPITSCTGGNPYNHEELKNLAKPYGGIDTVTSVSVHQGNGVTNEVIINGNIRLSGIEFKMAYNVRAPGYLRIPQGLKFGSSTDFAFFNIEKK